MNQKMRVKPAWRWYRDYGYVDDRGHPLYSKELIQKLQVKRWWGWHTIDTEVVPDHVLIARGATGFDCSNWRSKFLKYGDFGRDGIIFQGT